MSAVEKFVACARAQVGKPYQWATAGPDLMRALDRALDWLAVQMCRVACRTWGHDWRFVERGDVGELWAICESCGERRMGW